MDNNTINYNPDGQADEVGDSQYNSAGQYDVNNQYETGDQYSGGNQYNTVPYNMNGSYDAGNQYGQPNQYYQQPYRESIYAQPGESGSTDGKAIASLILGIFSLVTCCCYGVTSLVFGIAAIVLAVLSKKDNMGQMPGMAVAGMIMGIIGIVSGFGCIAALFLGILVA